MTEFIGKTIVVVFAIIFTLWIIKLNQLEPGIRIKHHEWHRTFHDRDW